MIGFFPLQKGDPILFEFSQLFQRSGTVRRYLAAPLARSRLDYLAYRSEQDASLATLKKIASVQVQAIPYLQLGDEGEVTRSRIAEAAGRWASREPGCRDVGKARRTFVLHVVGWLRFASRLEDPSETVRRRSGQVEKFVEYMQQERGWSESTIHCYCAAADRFVGQLANGNRTLADARIRDIDRALGAPNARNGRPRARNTIRTHAHVLRAFLCFAADRGWCDEKLVATITAPRVYRDEKLPAGPSSGDVRRLLAAVDGTHPAERRDRALLTMIAVHGLRADEASRLRLDDLDWEAETLRVRRAKTGRCDLLPLSRRAGDALAIYLREARPRVEAREVFLGVQAPEPMSGAAISRVVRKHMQQVGIDCRRPGAHALRHACAQRLLDEGLSLAVIGSWLGHTSLNSTAVYAKVGLAGLREVAAFDLEGLA